MLDITFVKENKEKIRYSLDVRNKSHLVNFDKLLEDIENYSNILKKVESHRALRNRISEDIPRVSGEAKEKLLNEARNLKSELQELEDSLLKLKIVVDEQIQWLPNTVSDDMPIGKGENDNVVLKVWLPDQGYITAPDLANYTNNSYMPKVEFSHKDHLVLGEKLDIIDTQQSAKMSGSRFCYLKKDLVLLQDALSLFFKKKLLESGFFPIIPPILLKERALYGTSHFPEGKDQVYKIESANVEDGQELYLVGSSEPANFAYFADRVLDQKELPIKVYAQTACFRSEVGSWGKDVKGIKRVHQFDKLELNCVCTPEQSKGIFDEFLMLNEWMYQKLRIPYRIVNKCTGDCGYNASNFQYDIEAWRPGEREFMEVGSNTITTDYQSRTLNIRYKSDDGLKFVHTVNDTGIPFGRVLIAIMENYQNEDGTITVPEVLQPYTGFTKIS